MRRTLQSPDVVAARHLRKQGFESTPLGTPLGSSAMAALPCYQLLGSASETPSPKLQNKFVKLRNSRRCGSPYTWKVNLFSKENMREICSSHPRLVYSANGALKLVRTGTDHACEHNHGPFQLAPVLRAGHFPENATLLDKCRVAKPELVEFHRLPVETGLDEEAILGVNLVCGRPALPSELPSLTHPQTLSSLRYFHDGVASALTDGNFAIRVRGAAKVEALAQFHQEMIAGNVALLPDSWNITGVAFVNVKELSPSERDLFEKDTQRAIVDWFRTPVLNRNS